MRLKQIQKDLVEALGASKPKTSGYDTEATVIRIEGQTAWVHIPGGIDETPVAMTINSKRGDKVRVRVSGGTAWLIGNDSAPPTDDRKAVEAAEKADNANKVADSAKKGAEAAWEYAGIARNAAESAETSATAANTAANNALTQLSVVEDVAGTLAWIQEHGTYVASTDTSVVPGTVYFILQGGEYVPIALPDPAANPAAAGWYVLDITDSQSQYIMAHLAVTSAGLWVLPTSQYAEVALTDENDDQIVNEDDDNISVWAIDPQNADGYKVLLSGTGMTVYNGEGAAVAVYSDTITIGEASGNNVYIDSDSVDVRNGSNTLATFGTETIIYSTDGTELAHFGYDYGAASSGSAIAPYYSLGSRASGTPGNYSTTLGLDNIADGYISYAEGNQCEAYGGASHAEGALSIARGNFAHAEGFGAEANANYSHANGYYTVADQNYQTAIGKYNKRNTGSLFSIGNGTANNARSDAFTVDDSGNVMAAGKLTAGNIDAGLTSATVDTAAGTYQDVSIAFHKTFAAAPVVVVGFDTTGTQANFGHCCVAVVNGSITTTGFTARVFNADSAVRKPRVSWIAIGV